MSPSPVPHQNKKARFRRYGLPFPILGFYLAETDICQEIERSTLRTELPQNPNSSIGVIHALKLTNVSVLKHPNPYRFDVPGERLSYSTIVTGLKMKFPIGEYNYEQVRQTFRFGLVFARSDGFCVCTEWLRG